MYYFCEVIIWSIIKVIPFIPKKTRKGERKGYSIDQKKKWEKEYA